MSSSLGPRVDLSPLEGWKIECLDNCQLCCLCQPELLPQEERWFGENYPDQVEVIHQPHEHMAIRMKKGGPCNFLEGRRCSIYPLRPHFCRQFPIHIYVGERVQAELDLSCRGVWGGGGEEAKVMGEAMIREDMPIIRSRFPEMVSLHRRFWNDCREAGIYREPGELRSDLQTLLPGMGMDLLARLLECSMEEEEAQPPEGGELTPKERSELGEAVVELAMSSLSAESAHAAPVYCDREGKWNIFFPKDERIEWMTMDEEGDLHTLNRIDPFRVDLRLEGALPGLMIEYALILNQRDSLLGYACHLVDLYDYEEYLSNTYYGVMATSLLDLWFRICLLLSLSGAPLDREAVREGIIFYDMDRLGAPTLGDFL